MELLQDINKINTFIETNKIALLYISSEGCNVCKVILPRLTQMQSKYQELMAAKANIEELPLLGSSYSVFTVPCVIIFAEGKEIYREARFIHLEAIEEKIVRYRGILF